MTYLLTDLLPCCHYSIPLNGKNGIIGVLNDTINMYQELMSHNPSDDELVTYKEYESDIARYREIISKLDPTQTARGGARTVKHNGKSYKVRTGARGGKYILVGKGSEATKVYV